MKTKVSTETMEQIQNYDKKDHQPRILHSQKISFQKDDEKKKRAKRREFPIFLLKVLNIEIFYLSGSDFYEQCEVIFQFHNFHFDNQSCQPNYKNCNLFLLRKGHHESSIHVQMGLLMSSFVLFHWSACFYGDNKLIFLLQYTWYVVKQITVHYSYQKYLGFYGPQHLYTNIKIRRHLGGSVS